MSEYLIKCLWKGVADVDQQQDAAERIEELDAELDAMAKVLLEAMVVPEAWMVSGFPDMSSEAKEQITASVMKARTTLAKMKGQGDE